LRIQRKTLSGLSVEKERAIKQLAKQGKGISEIARVVGLSRPTIYKAIG
jgi:DNA-binding CsgD family transcriptional regulator